MGLILDSTVLIAAERKGKNAHNVLAEIGHQAPAADVAISVITLLELAHGVARSSTPEKKSVRQRFLNELIAALPVHPVSISIALRTGRVDAEIAARGLRLALSDLLIGVTALELGYSVATANVRHFEQIPGLHVVHL